MRKEINSLIANSVSYFNPLMDSITEVLKPYIEFCVRMTEMFKLANKERDIEYIIHNVSIVK